MHENTLLVTLAVTSIRISCKSIGASRCNKYNGFINFITGERANTPHHTFVDDNHMVDLRRCIYLAMAASIEALFRIFGFPNEAHRRVPLSMDKYYHAKCSTRKEQLMPYALL